MESTVLGSRYELLERVGMGGMAVVYKAKDRMLNRFVAVKILREEFKENEDFIRRFKIESQAAASLSHQNIAQIYDVGEENGMNYIVMEFLEGVTLKKHILNNDGALSRKEAINYSMQICRALEHAHSKYVVHRDIKPQNIVITESGKLKLADFGIARAANNTTTVNSKNNMAVGSAHYLSPEQARGGYTDHRSDIYSLGVVMYEMFCGMLPFDAEESISVVMQHLHEEPARPCEVNPDLPEGIEAIILRAMKKEQRLRYENVSQILEDLILVYQNPSIDVSELNASSNEEDASSEKKERPKKTHRTSGKATQKKKSLWLIPVIIIVFFVMAAVAGYILMQKLASSTGKEVEIPNLVGLTVNEAKMEAEKASTNKVKFTVLESKVEFSEMPKGTITSQDPIGGGKVKRSRQIRVVISRGPVVVTLENYSGRTYEAVVKELTSLGIIVETETVDDASFPEGTIVYQSKDAYTQLGEGDSVKLFVAGKPQQTYVPDVVGKVKEDAIKDIEDNELIIINFVEDNSSHLPKGMVSKQIPEANEKVPVRTSVTLYISSGKNENVSVTLSNLEINKKVRVTITGNSGTVFESEITSSTGTETVTFKSDGSLSYDISYDGEFKFKKEVTS